MSSQFGRPKAKSKSRPKRVSERKATANFVLGLKSEPELRAYGGINVYNIDGKAYYKDPTSKQFVRAEERDNLIVPKSNWSKGRHGETTRDL